MNRLEFLQLALKAIAEKRLSQEEMSILITLTRFNGYLISQLAREMGKDFQKPALASLGKRGFVRGVKPKRGKRFRYSLTEEGQDLMLTILGKGVYA